MKTAVHFCSHLTHFFLEWEMFQTKFVEKKKQPGRGFDHPLRSSAEVKETVELYFYSPIEPWWPVLGRTLPLPLLVGK